VASDDADVARRLSTRFSPECWVALCVRVVAAGPVPDGDSTVRIADHYLAAAWPPLANGPARWPEAVVIGSPTSSRALAELARHLPSGAKLHLAGLDDVDAALAARILLGADRNLEPYQRDGIESFIRAESERERATLRERYTDRDAGFERFRARVLGR
jgi:hypothetical protein